MEQRLQHRVNSNQAIIDATELKRLPPAWMVPDGTIDKRIDALEAAPLLAARIAAVRRAREASLLGAVLARDSAQAVEPPDATEASRKTSAAAWDACRDVAPVTPTPCPWRFLRRPRAFVVAPDAIPCLTATAVFLGSLDGRRGRGRRSSQCLWVRGGRGANAEHSQFSSLCVSSCAAG